jgi:hypothetical protein
MDRFDDSKVGDKVYDRLWGEGKRVGSCNSKNISVLFDFSIVEFSKEGKAVLRNGSYGKEATLFYVDKDNKYAEKRPVPKVPWDKVPVDTKIMVSGMKRHYAGSYSYFECGATSWSTEPLKTWSITRDTALAEEIIINGVVYPIGSK